MSAITRPEQTQQNWLKQAALDLLDRLVGAAQQCKRGWLLATAAGYRKYRNPRPLRAQQSLNATHSGRTAASEEHPRITARASQPARRSVWPAWRSYFQLSP